MEISKESPSGKSWTVLHLSTGHEGGAGIAARRLNTALNKAGVKSNFIALRNGNYKPAVNEYALKRNTKHRLLSKASTLIQNLLSDKVLFTIWSANLLTKRRLQKFSNSDVTILHFHNWFNLTTQKRIIKLGKMGYPIVITLHDERFFTGGCHYAFECSNFKAYCYPCPQLIKPLSIVTASNLNKARQINSIPNLAIIAPSKWIENEANNSSVFKNQNRIFFIPNTLGDFSFRMPQEIEKLPEKLLTVGVASKISDSFVKGGDLIRQVEELVKFEKAPIKIIYLNSAECQADPESNFWLHIDLLLVPSRADNSPNVIHEAKTFGIPILGSNVGGITELLQEGFDELIPFAHLSPDYVFERLKSWRVKDERQKSEMQNIFHQYIHGGITEHIALYEKVVKSS